MSKWAKQRLPVRARPAAVRNSHAGRRRSLHQLPCRRCLRALPRCGGAAAPLGGERCPHVHAATGTARCQLSSDWTITADANIVFARGKRRAGYEVTAKTDYSGEFNGQPFSGTLSVPHVDETEGIDGSFEVNLSSKTGGEAGEQARRELTKALAGPLKAAFKQFHDELLAYQ